MIAQQGTLEISRGRLAHNLAMLRQKAGRAEICATIKADAYGHGVDVIAGLLKQEGVSWACVYSLSEALAIARFRPFKLLVLSPLVLHEPAPSMAQHVLDMDGSEIRFNVTDLATAEHLSRSVTELEGGRRWPVHVQVDAGLTRAGVARADALDLVRRIGQMPGLRLEGLFAHLSHGDVPGHVTLAAQLGALKQVALAVAASPRQLVVHLQNSGGLFHLQEDAGLDMVRAGIALYGMQPSMRDPIAGLQPIARLVAPILALHDRPAGTGVGYGHTFVTQRPSRLALVPVGYAEGYPRGLSNRGVAQVRGRDVPVVGRVSMDQIILDVTDLDAAAPGEPVTVISWDPERENCLDRMASATGTIGYELATHLGGRLRRVVVD